MTVNAKEDSFSIAREKMNQLEEESKKSQTKQLVNSKRHSRKLGCVNADKKSVLNNQTLANNSINDDQSLRSNVPLHQSAAFSNSPSQIGSGPSPPLPNPALQSKSLR